MKVEYIDDNGQETQAFFADGGMIGRSGVLGGTKKIFDPIKQLEGGTDEKT